MTEFNDEKHNRLVAKFMKENIIPHCTGERGFAEVMTITETLNFGIMLVLHDHYRMEPSEAARLVEVMIDQAITRFSKQVNNRRKQ